jgi:hypothetical protein
MYYKCEQTKEEEMDKKFIIGDVKMAYRYLVRKLEATKSLGRTKV